MTIANKLALLEQTKEAQRVKLGLSESVPFADYIKYIRDPFTPAELFENGEQGVWFDPSDLTTMFQDVAGTEPVTKDGDPVALIKDKSGSNNHAMQTTASARPIYRTDGNLHWLEFDGVDDYLLTTGTFKAKNLFISTLITQPVSGLIARNVNTNYLLRTSSGYRYTNIGGSLILSVYSIGNKDIFTFNTSLNGDYMRLNSKVVSSTPANTFNLTAPYFLGSSVSNGVSAVSLGGNIYGVIATEDLMSNSKVGVTESYLAAKSGVTL